MVRLGGDQARAVEDVSWGEETRGVLELAGPLVKDYGHGGGGQVSGLFPNAWEGGEVFY